MYKGLIKRGVDFLASLMGLILLSPIFIIVFILLAWSHRGSPLFLQWRPGKHERLFRIIKFKTMNDERDSNGQLLSDAERLTTIGKWVRKTSLDELPQLINVLKGDMSLVGPRPLLIEYLPLYNEFQRQRHNLRPGITGWAQVNGRNNISWQEKFQYDIEYVEKCSFLFDIKI